MLLLFSMSLMGSISLFFFVLLDFFNPNILSVHIKRVYLIITASMFIVPYPYFLIMYRHFLETCFIKAGFLSDNVSSLRKITENIIQVTPNGIYNKDLKICICLAFGSTIIISFFIHSLIKYKKCKNFFTRNNLVKYVTLGKMQIPLYECPNLDTPFVIGIRQPALVIPDKNISQYDLNLITEHELTHIKHYDNHWKILFMLIIMLHFYNPFVYILFSLWNKYTEIYCDITVIRGKTAYDINNYARLIIDLSTANETNRKWWPLAGFNLNSNNIKGRIEMIKKRHITRPIISTLIMLSFFFLSSFSVLAYAPKSVLHLEEIGDTIWIEDSSLYFESSDDYLHSFSDDQFLIEYSDGKHIYIDNPEFKNDTKSVCIHQYDNCRLSSHSMNSSGGCTVTTYNARVCSRCHNTIIDGVEGKTIKTKCPHQQ